MKLRVIAQSLGGLLGFLALVGLLPLGADLVGGHPTWPWIAMIAITAVTGGVMWWWGRQRDEQIGLREGIAVTTLIWLVSSIIAGVGIWLATPGATYIESWFEAMSGITTTGATVFGEHITIEQLSPGVLLWRSLMQWMGGIGIVVISLALLPLLVSGSGFQLYRAEVPGIDTDRLAPRISGTARILLRLYLGMTAGVFVALLACGVGSFDAINHAMTTVATGGYSTYDASVHGLGSAAAEWVLIIGMLLGGLNFGLLLHAIRGKPQRIWKSTEAKVYFGLIVAASLLIISSLFWNHAHVSGAYHGNWHDLIRDSIFHVISLMTSTGYTTGYDTYPHGWNGWPAPAVATIMLLVVFCGCAGSTSGGIKLIRLVVVWKAARRELRRYVEPARISPVQIEGHSIKDSVVLQVGAFLFIYSISWGAGLIIFCSLGHDLLTSATVAVSCLSNIGPALGDVAEPRQWSALTPTGQLVAIFMMLLGRLEFFGVLMLLRPRHWRR